VIHQVGERHGIVVLVVLLASAAACRRRSRGRVEIFDDEAASLVFLEQFFISRVASALVRVGSCRQEQEVNTTS